MLSSKIPRKQVDNSFQVYEDEEDDSEVAAFLGGQEPLAFSFTGIPLARPKSQCNRRPAARPPAEKAAQRPPQMMRARHGSMGSLSIEEASPPRVDAAGDGVRRSRSRGGLRPPRSSSCARAVPSKDGDPKRTALASNSGDASDRLPGLPLLRQTLPLLRRSLSDLNAMLGVDPGRSQQQPQQSLEDENQRLEADWALFCRQLAEEPRKTAVVPPFAVVPPPQVSEEPPPRPATPSRIPVPRAASPAMKTRRSMSVCQENADKSPLERRSSCDLVKISTPLVTGRSSIVGSRSGTPSRVVNAAAAAHRSRRG